MNNTRRSYLAGLAVATTGSLPNMRIQDSSEDYPPVFEGSYRLSNHIFEEYGIPVSIGAQPNDTLILAYRPGRSELDEYLQAIRSFSEAYATYTQDYPFGRLDGFLTNRKNDIITSWLVQPEWATLNESELHSRVETTIVPYEDYSPSQLQAESHADDFQELLPEYGIEGGTTVQQDHQLSLYYTSQSNVTELEESETLSEEVGTIAYLYAFMISQGSPVGNLNVRVDGVDTVHIGRWYIERDWAIDYNMAALNQEEYEEKILETAENYVVEELPEDY